MNVFVPAACVTVTVCPPIVTVPVRSKALVVSAAVSVTLPLPVPLPGLTVNHARLLVAVHAASLAFDVTVTLVLAHDVDLSRGGMVIGRERPPGSGCDLSARVCWMHARPLQPGKRYLLKHAAQTVPVVAVPRRPPAAAVADVLCRMSAHDV